MRRDTIRYSTLACAFAIGLTALSACGEDEPKIDRNAAVLSSDEQTKGAQKVLSDLKLPSDTLGDLGLQLTVPDEWIAKARDEGEVVLRIDTDPGKFDAVEDAFEERYPFINLKVSYGSGEARTTQVLTAFQQGKFMTDVLAGLGQDLPSFRDSKALADISDLPSWNSVPAEAKSAVGDWISYAAKFWGFCVNTNEIDPADLPASWDEVLTDPAFRDGAFGLGNRPNLFLYQLAAVKGIPWAQNFMKKLFTEVNPSKREEGMDAIPQLVANGTLSMSLPCGTYTTEPLEDQGASVTWYSPDPVVVNYSDLSAMKNAEHPYAARIYLNWITSSEGQVVSAHADNVAPIREELTSHPEFFAYGDRVANAPRAVMPPEDESIMTEEIDAPFQEFWGGK